MRWIILSFAIAACTAHPTPTGAKCADPDPGTPSWSDFGEAFMTKYCTMCHDSHLLRSQRNGAPIYHDFDTLTGVKIVVDHIDEYAGSGPNADNHFMPGVKCPSTPGGPLDTNCTQPTEDERRTLAIWMACEKNRGLPPADAGVDAMVDAQ